MGATNKVETLTKTLKSILEYNKDELIHRKDWGSFNFENSKEEIESIFDLAKRFEQMPLSSLRDKALDSLNQNFNQCLSHLKKINDHNINKNDHLTDARKITDETTKSVDALYENAHSWLGFLVTAGGDFKKIARDAEATKKEIDDVKKQADSNLEDMTKIIEELETKAGNVGVEQFHHIYLSESDEQNKKGKKWLVTTISLFVVLIISLFFTEFGSNFKDPSIQSIVKLMNNSSFLLTLILGLSTMWCGKIYKACIHRSEDYKARANNIKSFRAFAESTENEEIKDYILTKTTDSIYSSFNTGLIPNSRNEKENEIKYLPWSKMITRDKD